MLCFIAVQTEIRYHEALAHINPGEKVAWGEGVIYGQLLMYALGVGGTAITLLNAAVYREQRGFYLLVSILIAIPAIIVYCFTITIKLLVFEKQLQCIIYRQSRFTLIRHRL